MSFLKSLFGRKKEEAPSENTVSFSSEKEAKVVDKKDERDADTLKFDALRALKMGQVDFALKALSKALELHPEFETRFYYAEALTLDRQYAKAWEQYDSLLAEHPDHILSLKNRASLRIAGEDYVGALEDIEAALRSTEEEEQKMVLYQQQSKVFLKQEIFDKSLEAAEKAIALKSPSPLPYLQKVEALIGLSQVEEAKRFIKEASSLFPEEEQFSLAQAKIALVQKEYAEAYRAYQEALEKDPFNEEAYCGTACLMLQEGKEEEAVAYLEAALEDQNVSYTLLSLLLNLYQKKGWGEKAESIRRQMEELAPEQKGEVVDFVQQYYKNNVYGEIFGGLFS